MKIFKLRSYFLYIARLLSPLISIIESRIYRSEESGDAAHYPIFIIGAPRSGSTILYQMLTHTIDCLYIDNLAYLFFNNLPFGLWLSNKIYGNRSHNSFYSKYGNTRSWHSPSECGGFWYRWFPKDKDFVDFDELSESSMVAIKDNLNLIMNKYKKNIIFKNLNAGMRIRVIQEIFPDAKFVFIRRDPLFTVQSLLLARKNNNISDEKWWSIKPHNYKEIAKLPICEKLISQIFHIEQQIVQDLKTLPRENVFVVNYVDYKARFHEIESFINSKVKNDIDLSSFEFINTDSLSTDKILELEKKIAKHDWNSIKYE